MNIPTTEPSLDQRFPTAMLYQENSVLNPARGPAFQERIMSYTKVSGDVLALPNAHAKTYPHCSRIALPDGPRRRHPVERTIWKRRTRRAFTRKGISLLQLGRVLRCAYGVTGRSADDSAPFPVTDLRACPSAGALYPLEVYPVVLRSRKLSVGVYHYNVPDHALERLVAGDFRSQLESNLLGIEMAPGADAALLISCVLDRTLTKYGERGYRFILIEVGHLAQNVALACEAFGLNSVYIGGFYEDGLAELLGTDRRHEPVQYVILLGTR